MPAPRVYRTEAIVLKAFDYGEADRILTLYTPQRGKVRAIAKGVRKTRSRMGGHLDLFTRSELLLARGRQLDIVTQADTVESYVALRAGLLRTALSTYVAELVDAFASEEQANRPLYDVTVHTLRGLAGEDNPELAARVFEVGLLEAVGYRPQLQRCLACNNPIEPVTNQFSAALGGVLCPLCGPSDPTAKPVSPPALKLLRHLQARGASAAAVSGVPTTVQREVERLLQEYISYRLEARPRSLAFLERVRSEATAR